MRRRRAERRKIKPDLIYNDKNVAKFINMVMTKGKKLLAQRIVYNMLAIIKERTGKNELEVFNETLESARPKVEVRPRRIGGATYQVPMKVRDSRSFFLAMSWLRDAARAKKGKPIDVKLAEEVLLAYKGEGAVIKKRDDTHKMAEANKAFEHFRW